MNRKIFLLLSLLFLTTVVFSQQPSNDSLKVKNDSLKEKKGAEIAPKKSTEKIVPPSEIYQTFGQIYDRIELNRGYYEPIPQRQTVASFLLPKYYNFVRSRFGLNFYKRNKFTFRITFQNVKYLGVVPDFYHKYEKLSEPLYEAWVKYYLGGNFSIKAGLMPLSFDDQRILGEKDWLPEALNHNAIMLAYDGIFSVHLGVAYDFYNPLDITGTLAQRSYKFMQFVWISGNIGTLDYSFLGVNTSFPEIEYLYSPFYDYLKPLDFDLVSTQTFGVYANIGPKPLYFEAEVYYQMGQYPHDWVQMDSLNNVHMTLLQLNNKFGTNLLGGPKLGNRKSAYMYSVIAHYDTRLVSLALGYDFLSGDSYSQSNVDINNVDNAFDPVLGSNHRFYGAMDYFYTNSWTKAYSKLTPGLRDIHGKLQLKTKLFDFSVAGHYFLPAGTVYYQNIEGDTVQIKKLGYEGDFEIVYKVLPKIARLTLGGSVLKPTDGLLFLKNFDYTQRRQYYYTLWLSFKLTPVFYKAFKYPKKVVQEFSAPLNE